MDPVAGDEEKEEGAENGEEEAKERWTPSLCSHVLVTGGIVGGF